MRAVDTNVLIRLVIRDEAAQVEAAQDYIREGVWVSHVALAEAIWALGSIYRRSAREQADAVEFLLNIHGLVFEDAEIVEDALAAFREHPSVEFSDLLILESARSAGIPLGTFDKKLARVEGAELIRIRRRGPDVG